MARTVICSFARAARTVICSSFVRHLFVICSSFVRLLFVLCSSFVRSLFVFASLQFPLFEGVGGGYLCLFTIRLSCYDCLCGSHRHLFVIPSSHFSVTTLPLLGRGLGRGYFVHLPVVLRLPVRLAPACVAHTCLCDSYLPVRLVPLTLHFLLNCFPILIKILHRDFFSVKANIFKLFCYLTAFAYNDDSEVF